MTDPLTRARKFWKVAATFPPNKEEVYPEHAKAQEFDSFVGITPPMRVLEYGCGGGSDAMSFLRRGCHVTAVDIHPGNIATTELRVRDDADGIDMRRRLTTFVLEYSESIPVGSDNFDVASAHGVLHHIQRPVVNLVVKELRRVLKKGGSLYTMLYTPRLETEQRESTLALQKQHGLSYGEALGWAIDGHGCPWAESYTELQARELFEPAGFALRSTFEYHDGRFRTFRWTAI